jgi:hypothetical protein
VRPGYGDMRRLGQSKQNGFVAESQHPSGLVDRSEDLGRRAMGVGLSVLVRRPGRPKGAFGWLGKPHFPFLFGLA